MLLAPVMPKPRRSTMALSVELLVFSRWMPACVDSRSCMVRALLAAISSAVITETATGRVAASEGTRCAVTMTGLSSVGAGVCWAAARAGAEQSRTPALRRRVRAFICMTSKRPATPQAIHDGRTPRPADREGAS